MNIGDPERAAALAGEYVLGTLRGRARARFERLAHTERSLADAIHAWEERLLPLSDILSPIEPPARVWTAIAARIGHRALPTARAPASARAGWWRALALASLTVAFALAVALFRPAAERPEGALVVILSGQDAKPALVATTDRSSRYLTVTALAPVAVAGDRVLELWLLPDRGSPRSLGLVAATGSARVALPAPAAQVLQHIPALAVSLEPKGGSPTGLPTGPVLYSGPIQRLD